MPRPRKDGTPARPPNRRNLSEIFVRKLKPQEQAFCVWDSRQRGLATDYCVAFSALDARAAGFETFVIEDACRAIDANNSLDAAWARMNAAEVWRVQSRELLE